MENTFYFQNLDIYQLAKSLAIETYKFTKNFPSEERFCLINQMNRSAISVPSNIAEGVSRKGKKDKIHFLNIAFASLMELVCQTEISSELGYLSQEELCDFTHKAKNIVVKLHNYITYLENEATSL